MSSVISLIQKLKERNSTVVVYDDILYSTTNITQNNVSRLEQKYHQLKEFDMVIYAVNHQLYEDNKANIIRNSQLFYDLTLV